MCIRDRYTNQLEGILYGQEGLSEILSLLSSAGLFAGGGIAKQAGIDSGPPPISGPTPDGDEGLPAAFKRGIKT